MTTHAQPAGDFDPYLTAIIANRVEGIVREMSNALQRAARSAVITSARDFSCTICTADHQILTAADTLPAHIYGSNLQSRAVAESHAGDIREGDCFLHNDPYTGNTHPGDHTLLAPVFIDGEHLFTTTVKAHQADIGNALPTTMNALARDQYEEGALIFPSVRIQREFRMVEDIVRMCRSRIRAPSQWYGDLLAAIGCVRVGERRLKELCERYGKERIRSFVQDWLDYSEQRMDGELRKLPPFRLSRENAHDPLPGIWPEGIPVRATIEADPANGLVTVDLTDNVENVPLGLNMTEACVNAAVISGIYNVIDPSIPRNSGAFRRIRVLMRDGAAVGRPKFPHSCSLATTNLTDRLINLVQSTFAEVRDGLGLAEGGVGMGIGISVVSGRDDRAHDGFFVNMLAVTGAGGPGGPEADGWPTYALPANGGLLLRDSIEIDELKHPILFRGLRILPGTAGAGRFRGAPAIELGYGPIEHDMEVIWSSDGTYLAPAGVRGGQDGTRARHFRVNGDGTRQELENSVHVRLGPGDHVIGHHSSGAGYGDPRERDPGRVLADVLEGYETRERACEVYCVVLHPSPSDDGLEVDEAATAILRERT